MNTARPLHAKLSQAQPVLTAIRPSANEVFSNARDEYHKGHIFHALQTAKYALRLARENESYSEVYVCGFLAQLKLELGQKEKARWYCLQAINALDEEHEDYAFDSRFYRALFWTIHT